MVPTIRERLASTGIEGGFVQDSTARELLRAGGYTTGMAVGFIPVARDPTKPIAATLDFLGVGSSTVPVGSAAALAETTERAVRMSDALLIGKESLSTDEDIWEAGRNIALKQVAPRARRMAKEAEDRLRENRRRIKKGEEELDTVTFRPYVNYQKMAQELHETYGVPKNRIRNVFANRGLNLSDDPLEVLAEDRLFSAGDGTGAALNWYDRTLAPVADVIRNKVDARAGGLFEVASETATRRAGQIASTMGKKFQDVIKAVDQDEELFKMFLDVGKRPELMPKIRRKIERATGPEGLKEFDTFLAMSQARNGRARELIFRGDGFDDTFYFHTQKQSADTTWQSLKRSIGTYGKAYTDKPNALKERTRPAAADMTATELARYQNPLVSHMKYLAEQEQLVALAEEFGTRPSMKLDDNIDRFFSEIRSRMIRDGMDKNKARMGAELMRQAYMGAKTAPPPSVRAFMSLSYAGTLAQLKTAVLNLHDIAVAMTDKGVRPTMASLFKSNRAEFGKTLDQMGLGDQSVGEFVRNFDKFMSNPTAMERVAYRAKEAAEVSMAVSQFKRLDRIGKGTVLRATVNKAREAAKDNRLAVEFGDVLTPDQMTRIRPYLKSGYAVKDMPEDVARIVEQMAFTGLGRQQLISSAGRPLNYLRYEILRPLYALTGFAIKQQALLRKNVYDAARKGDYAAAGSYAARYAAFAGLGYGVLNEGREAAFKGEEFNSEDIMVGAADQIAAAITLNKLGDDYGRAKFLEDPVQFVMESVLPPTGLAGAVVKDATDMVFKGEYNAELAKRFPLLGDFYKYYWEDQK